MTERAWFVGLGWVGVSAVACAAWAAWRAWEDRRLVARLAASRVADRAAVDAYVVELAVTLLAEGRPLKSVRVEQYADESPDGAPRIAVEVG